MCCPCGSRVMPNANKKECNFHLVLHNNANSLSVFPQNVLPLSSSQKDLDGAKSSGFYFDQMTDRPVQNL